MVHGRPTYALINLDALQHNFFRARDVIGPGRETLAVVKADAYGHGVQGVVPALDAAGAHQFGVAMVAEGVELRQLGLRKPILVLGGVHPGEETAVLEHDLTPVISELQGALSLDSAARKAGQTLGYHLKVDTGMGRLGLRPEQLDEVLPQLGSLRNLQMVGLMSHLAAADEPGRTITDEQVKTFKAIVGAVEGAGFHPHYRHIANSAALYSRNLEGCNLVRPGIALYGGLTGETAGPEISQRQVMQLVSSVALIKKVPPGDGVSYGHRFVATRPSLLAAVPIGYADGYHRLLSNCGEVLIHGQRARVAGTVCMDWIMVDITALPDVQVGDKVVLLGGDGDDAITAEEWAGKVGTITYEVFCSISKRVPRVFVGTGQNSG